MSTSFLAGIVMAFIAMTLAFLKQGKAAYSGDGPLFHASRYLNLNKPSTFDSPKGCPPLGLAKVRLSGVPDVKKGNKQSTSGIQLFQRD